MKKTIILFFTLLGLTGCSYDHGHFTVLSNQLISKNDFSINTNDNDSRPVKGNVTNHIIILFPTRGSITLNEVLDDAFEQAPNRDFLTDANLRNWGWVIPYIYGQMGWEVKGTALKSK